MDVPDEFFDTFHRRHPHRIRIDRAAPELGETACEALKAGKTLTSPDGHKIQPVTRSVRPWINWRREFEQYAPERTRQILEDNEPADVLFAEIT